MLFRKVTEVQRPCCCPKKKSFLLEGELCTCSLHITFSVFIWNCNLKNQLFICFKEKFGTVLPIQKKKTLLEKKKKKVHLLSVSHGGYLRHWEEAVLFHKQPLHHQVALPMQPSPAPQHYLWMEQRLCVHVQTQMSFRDTLAPAKKATPGSGIN